MAISGLKTWADGDALTPDNMNADKSILEAKFGGNIDTADLASSSVTNDKLANKHYEIVLTMHVDGAAWNATAADAPVITVPFPADVTSIEYTVVQVDVVQNGDFDDELFRVEYGYYNAGSWDNSTGQACIVADNQTLASTASNWKVSSLTNSTITTDTSSRPCLAVVVDTEGAKLSTIHTEWFDVSIKLKRTNGLRS